MVKIAGREEQKLKNFVKTLNREFRINAAYLFGSYPKGTADKYSDIDLALVSEDFQGIPFYDRAKLVKHIIRFDSRIEIHPFRPEDFTRHNPFVVEILKRGINLL